MTRARRIVVCDRSQSRTLALTRFLERDPEIEIAGTFATVEAMVPALAGVSPDLVALDLGTAGDDVAASIDAVKREGPVSLLILGNGAGEADARIAAALGAGALEAIEGAGLDFERPEGLWATALRSRIKRLASHHSGRRHDLAAEPAPAAAPAGAAAAPTPWRRPGATYRAIGIGASVGGPPALAMVLGRLPADFALPVLVVQHMASGFGESLAAWLDRTVEIPVQLAVNGAPLQPGAWLAPDGVDLRLSRALRLTLDATSERRAHRPSLDVLLESLAESVGADAVGVVLTGMGRDGAEGVRAIAAAGGLTIAQDEQSSAVFGMPAAAIEAGAARVLPLEELAASLASLRARSGS